MSIRPMQERRRGHRIPLAFHVEVSGMGQNGVPYCDQAAASDVSERGCKVRLTREVRPGDLLTIRVIRREERIEGHEKPFLFQAVWVETDQENGWTAGLCCLESGNPWRMYFPQKSLARS